LNHQWALSSLRPVNLSSDFDYERVPYLILTLARHEIV